MSSAVCMNLAAGLGSKVPELVLIRGKCKHKGVRENMQKVLIVGSSKQPIPAVKGGAVPALIEELIS